MPQHSLTLTTTGPLNNSWLNCSVLFVILTIMGCLFVVMRISYSDTPPPMTNVTLTDKNQTTLDPISEPSSSSSLPSDIAAYILFTSACIIASFVVLLVFSIILYAFWVQQRERRESSQNEEARTPIMMRQQERQDDREFEEQRHIHSERQLLALSALGEM